LEFFQIAQEEYGLSSLLLQQRRDSSDEGDVDEDGDMVNLYALYFASVGQID
jgi:hypothetical protein